MDKLGLKTGDDITDIMDWKAFDKTSVVEDMEKNGFMSAFHALRKKIEAFKGDTILIVADLDCTYKEMCNFYWCSSEDSVKEHMERFQASGEGPAGDSKQAGGGRAVKDMLVKYLSVLRVTKDKKISTIGEYSTDAKEDEHREVCENLVKVHGSRIFGVRPLRSDRSEACDYMVIGVKIDDDYELEKSQLVIAAAFGKLFSRLAEPEMALYVEKAFKFSAAIGPTEAEAAGPLEFNERLAEPFERVSEQFNDEIDDPNEVIPEYEDKPIVPQRTWSPLEKKAVLDIDEKTKPENRPKKRSLWVFGEGMPAPSVDRRGRIAFEISKPRRDFAQNQELEDFDDDVVFFPAQPEFSSETFAFERTDVDIGFQCVSNKVDGDTQTPWSRKVNKSVQVEPLQFNPDELKSLRGSAELASFAMAKVPVCKQFLDTNDVVNLYEGEFECMANAEASVGTGAESNLKSLNQLRVNGMPPRRVCAVDWHPTAKGIVAFACGSNFSRERKIEYEGKVMWTSIIVWNLNNLLRPRMRLVVPGDIQCFKINPNNPYLVAGGLETGQVILWDLSGAEIDGQDVYLGGEQVASGEDKKEKKVPGFPCKMTSVMSVSHGRGVTDIQWLPKGVVVTRRGQLKKDPEAKSPQFFATVAGDGVLCFWDIKVKKSRNADQSEASSRWGPVYKVPLRRPGGKVNLPSLKFEFLSSEDDSGSEFVTVTELGEVSIGSWARETDEEGKSKGTVEPVGSLSKAHDHCCVGVQQSPYFPDISMTLGDWTFKLWKRGKDKPIFTSSNTEAYVTAGRWSPTRPGVIIIGRSDGVLDIWDLIDQTHAPVMRRVVRANVEISSLAFWRGNQSQQLLAVGDFSGTLHVLNVPRILMRAASNEKRAMKSWYAHEIERQKYVEGQKKASDERRAKKAAEAKQKKTRRPERKEAKSEDQVLDEREKRYQDMLEDYKAKLLGTDAE